jgi:hypothetical protein
VKRWRKLLRGMRPLLAAAPLAIAQASDAAALELPRSESVPGGVRLIALPGPADTAPVALFAEHRVMVIRRGDQWLAVVGLALDTPVGQGAADGPAGHALPVSHRSEDLHRAATDGRTGQGRPVSAGREPRCAGAHADPRGNRNVQPGSSAHTVTAAARSGRSFQFVRPAPRVQWRGAQSSHRHGHRRADRHPDTGGRGRHGGGHRRLFLQR